VRLQEGCFLALRWMDASKPTSQIFGRGGKEETQEYPKTNSWLTGSLESHTQTVLADLIICLFVSFYKLPNGNDELIPYTVAGGGALGTF